MTQEIKNKFHYDVEAYSGSKEQKLMVNETEQPFSSKSEMFKFMYDEGATIAEISALTKCHYSFVYGVISSSREIVKTSGSNKSDDIRKFVDAGKTPGEIAKLLNSNYSFVHSVVKKYKAELAKVAGEVQANG